MVAKGLDFANVTLVGVINADTALNMPDFRAAERSFQLLMQVSGRAGRGSAEGAVMVQTFNPDHDAVRLAAAHDYQSFYDIEIANRGELRYPPFASLANIIVTDEDEKRVVEHAHSVARKLREVAASMARDGDPAHPARPIDILGPVACPLERLRNRFRWHVLVRSEHKPTLLALMRRCLAELGQAERAGLTLDIDPLAML
jgi:primosomal protein N' (replication factor Y)